MKNKAVVDSAPNHLRRNAKLRAVLRASMREMVGDEEAGRIIIANAVRKRAATVAESPLGRRRPAT